ncbi:MAG: Effector-binding protein [Mucilaginibacter sp.]|nr:Effector-binding protein [Mucilaginibacter sp.]
MKKAVIILFLLIVIGFIPFQQHSSVNIRSNYFDVCQQLISPDSWKNWQPDIRKGFDDTKNSRVAKDNVGFLISIPGQVFNIKNANGNKFYVGRTVNFIDHHYCYTVMPGIANNTATVIIDIKNNVAKWLFSQFDPSEKNTDIIKQLKSFMEDDKQYYGFDISEKSVAESYLAVKKEMIPVKNKYSAIVKAAQELHDFVDQHNIKPVQALAGAYYSQKNDSLQILIGIPVNKRIAPTANIVFMNMPGGKVLVGDYSGKYGERQKIYNAMERYIQDHTLLKQVAPFERYLNNKVPESDTDIVNMQVNYPVL